MCRYGAEAGDAAKKGMGIAVDAYDVYGSYKNMRTKALVKAFAMGAIRKPGERTEGETKLERPEVASASSGDVEPAPSVDHMLAPLEGGKPADPAPTMEGPQLVQGPASDLPHTTSEGAAAYPPIIPP
jgi:hypothetical protein